jgi:hypothetical protein
MTILADHIREAGDHGQPDDDGCEVSGMNDFQVIAERHRVMTALAALTDRYRTLNHEIGRRETLRWMVTR